MQLEEALRIVAGNPDYQIIKRVDQNIEFSGAILDGKLYDHAIASGIILDTETTGVDEDGEIIQLSMIKYDYHIETGSVIAITDTYNQYNQPSKPISPEITALTGITNEMVAGHKFDQNKIAEFMIDVDLHIAHKADFDRPMMERNLKDITLHLVPQRWACSLQEIDWASLGFGTAKLDYLLFRSGYFYEAHRSDIDCLALLTLLDQEVDGKRHMRRLHESAEKNSYEIWAIGAPYSVKDDLKARGYKWNDGTTTDHKAWSIVVNNDEDYAIEMKYLEKEVYRRPNVPLVDKFYAATRYSTFKGVVPEVAQAPSRGLF